MPVPPMEKLNNKTDQMKNVPFFKRYKKTVISFGVIIVLFLGVGYYLGFQHIPHHVKELWQMIAGSTNNEAQPAMDASVAAEGTTTEVASRAPEFPLDTLMWVNFIKNGDYIPDGVKEELAAIRKTDFSKLIMATDKPDDFEIRQAIVQRFGEEAINLLKQNDATLKGGKAYNAPLQKSEKNGLETARVTMMVTAFNSKNDNLMNIQEPLLPAYDFVKYESDPDTWYVTDISQTIPFDYKLNKR